MQAASRRKSSISDRVQMATGEEMAGTKMRQCDGCLARCVKNSTDAARLKG